jgi:hypothetical protein
MLILNRLAVREKLNLEQRLKFDHLTESFNCVGFHIKKHNFKNKFFTLKKQHKNYMVIGRFELTTSPVQNQNAFIVLRATI